MKINKIEHFDNFGDSYVFWVNVCEVEEPYVSQSKQIDNT